MFETKYHSYSHTHRSFDYAEQMPQADIDQLHSMVSDLEQQYRVLFITDSTVKRFVYDQSQIPELDRLKYPDYVARKNSQLLCSLLIAILPKTSHHTSEHNYQVGHAYSQLALKALDLGWQTGFCICFERQPVEQEFRNRQLITANENFGSLPFLCIGHHDSSKPWNWQTEDVNQPVPSPSKMSMDQYIEVM